MAMYHHKSRIDSFQKTNLLPSSVSRPAINSSADKKRRFKTHQHLTSTKSDCYQSFEPSCNDTYNVYDIRGARYQVREPDTDYTASAPDTETQDGHDSSLEEIQKQATDFYDQMKNLHSLNSFFYITIEGMVKDVEILTEEVLFGLWLNMRWLHQESEQVRAAAKSLHTAINSIDEETDTED